MGYELDRLMQGYGVSMPSLGYSGAAAPGAMPTAPTNPTPTQAADYAAALEAYNAKKAAYDADRAAFDAYKQQYMARINPAAIYNQPQFNTGPRATAVGAPTAAEVAAPAAPAPVTPNAAAPGVLAPIAYPSASMSAAIAPAASDAAVSPLTQIAQYGRRTGDYYDPSASPDGTDPGGGWSSLTAEEQAAFYAEHPTFGAITQGLQGLFGLTTLGQLQNALVPGFVQDQHEIAQGIVPGSSSSISAQNAMDVGAHPGLGFGASINGPTLTTANSGGGSMTGGLIPMIVGQQPNAPVEVAIPTVSNAQAAQQVADEINASLQAAQSAADNVGPGVGGDAAAGGVSGADVGGIGGDVGVAVDSDVSDGSVWKRGGHVRRKYAEGGGVEVMADKYGLANPANLPSIMGQPAPQMSVAPPQGAEMSMVPPGGPAAVPAQPAAAPTQPAATGLEGMLAKYIAPQQSIYAAELKAARTRAQNETEAFNKLLERAMTETGDTAPSKAELYFRLAAAFGAPTKTGSFTESLAAAGKEMAESAKATREAAKADRAARLQLGITGAKARMEGARDELTTLRTLAGEEMRDARALTTKFMEQYIKSGQPESVAGKQAADEGLKPGTPEFQSRVKAIADQNIERQTAQVQSMIAQMGVAQAQLALAQGKFGLQQEQATKLTPAEVKLKTETEDALSATDSAMSALKQAYALNPNAFTGTLGDRAQRAALERTQGDNPRVVATRTLENLLKSQALSKLKDTFPGAISNDERKALEALQGIDAFSVEERAKIIRRAYEALQSARVRQTKRLNEIRQGLYRDTTPAGGIE